jgi:hypothetical protein
MLMVYAVRGCLDLVGRFPAAVLPEAVRCGSHLYISTAAYQRGSAC